MENNKEFDVSLFIFRRDHRLIDNNGLNAACNRSKTVIPIYHLNPVQVEPEKNPFFGHASVQIMSESLDDLNQNLQEIGSRVFYFEGELEKAFNDIIDETKPQAIFVNEDYSPFSRERDAKIAKICEEKGIKFFSHHDLMLIEKGKVIKNDGKFFTQFTPYFLKASKIEVPRPFTHMPKNFMSKDIEFPSEWKGSLHQLYIPNPKIECHGGRKNGILALDKLSTFKDYAKNRIYPFSNTTRVSAYAKYGAISIREIYWTIVDRLGKKHDLTRQLFWRDFYYNIMYFFPETVFNSFVPQFQTIQWPYDEVWFTKWKEGNTGYPFIDAGMRHLKSTNYFPNVMRLVVANFLVKILLIDWRKGQMYMARMMLDYDLAQNNGGWQWSASTGAFKQPFDVIFNPWIQSVQYDKECLYIKKWCPELKDVPPAHIHNWEQHYQDHPDIDYPKPIVIFEERRKEVLTWYSQFYTKSGKNRNGANDAAIDEAMFDDDDDEGLDHDVEDF